MAGLPQKGSNYHTTALYTAGWGWAGMRGGRTGGERHVYGTIAVLREWSSIFEDGSEGDVFSTLGGAGGGSF